jgi:hypothetical protein
MALTGNSPQFSPSFTVHGFDAKSARRQRIRPLSLRLLRREAERRCKHEPAC